MAKVAVIGAGSFGFARGLVRDLMTFPLLQGATIALMDINAERLAYIKRAVDQVLKAGGVSANVITTRSRKTALKGADAVICTILSGGVDVWRYDIEIPKRFGVDVCVGDTRGPSGIFRALRTIPDMLSICRDIERYCPDALLLNYTNPMSMLCRAMQRETKVHVVGLCHSVQFGNQMLARWIGAPVNEITHVCAGINHQAWFLKYEWKGRDAVPLIRKAILRSKKLFNEEQVRNEMFLHLDYYVTEGSGHNSEYNWWFRKRPDLIEKYCTHGTGSIPGKHACILQGYLKREKTWRRDIEKWIADFKPASLKLGQEYAAPIVNARLGGTPFKFNGNVPNTGLITNLPPNACVEVPAYADRQGIHPIGVGALPPQCAALNYINVAVEEMAVEAALTGDKQRLVQAVAYDPLTAAVLSLAEVERMVKVMLKKNKEYLPQFKQ